MSKILGLDLGTNSIGWALRNPDSTDNQIEKFGVLTFNKGVGLGKIGEYSYAAERTKKRATRRLYQARKYRLWATLEHLINEKYCPLSIEDLNKWRYYNKEEARKNNNAGRVYPIWNAAFDAWIKLDFDRDGKPDYASPYQLRKELTETKLDFTKEEDRFKLGRALYHIAQRRGFKSSRKGADDVKEKEVETIDDNEVELQKSEKKKTNKLKELFPDYDDSVPIGVFLANKENQGMRIRLDITQYLVRENYKDEIKHFFEFQELGFEHPLYAKLVETGKNKNDGSIFYKRPLRSQKGLIGLCTLEQETRLDRKTGKQVQVGKYRAPISHPSFETFRAWAFLNNIKYKENNEFKPLSLELKQEIYLKLFFRKSKAYFPFSEIADLIKARGKTWELNYNPKTTVTACPVSARLKDIFGDDYLSVKITKDKKSKSGKDYYDIEDIWHVLFSYEDQEYVSGFAEQKLNLEPEKIKQFVIAWNALPVGYGMLSINAINKINKFLQKGLIYTEAVLLANIPEIIGEKLWQENEKLLLDSIGGIIDDNRQEKIILNIVNNLVSKHKNLETNERFGGKNYKLVESDLKDIQIAIEEQFGINKWNRFSSGEKKQIADTVKDCYQAYFISSGLTRKDVNGERHFEVKSNNRTYYKSDSGYYRLPKLIDTLGEFLQLNFNVEDKLLSKIYHPSEISIYPRAKPDKDGTLKLGSPKAGSFKNPMAMRTLHELRKLMNYLIEAKQIDNETRVVVEVARELNDANKRWAIETWQRQREAENQEFEEAIKQILSKSKDEKIPEDDVDKVRLFYEQNTEQTLPPVVFESQDIKGKKKESSKKDEAIRWSGHGKKLIDKYRLWKEQGYQCLYTGKYIKLSDLFNENIIDFEHTVPRSQSFDNSFANLTVCYHDYNRTIKKNQIPTQLNNYDKDFDFGGSIGKCSAILPRLEAWKEKIERIKQQIDFWKTKSKKAADKSWKDDAIRQRHLWQMELDYWKNKLDRFTITEITSGFKNSQKVDTQLISKYAFHYLKTYFDKVDVQKGSITAEFRKIYQLQSVDEKKDRSKHSHHAKDASVLTLIPAAAKRDVILEKYYEAKENKTKFTETEPYKGFKREFVWSIDDSVLINNITNNRELTPAKRKVRKRGKEIFIPGTNKNMWATGDSVRGQLHQETFYGAIKPAQKGEKGNLLKGENGKFIQEEDVRYVVRIPFQFKKDASTPGFKTLDEIKKQVVDEGLKLQIEEQVNKAGGLKEAFEKGIYLLDKNGKPHGNKIRHIRVWASVSEPLAIKKQTNLSEKEYKQNYWAANGENIICAYYKNDTVDKNGKIKKNRELEIISLFDAARLKSLGLINVKGEIELYRKDKNNQEVIDENGNKEKPYSILKAGMKVIFYDEKIEELKQRENETDSEYNKRLNLRTYKVVKFAGNQITFLHHLEARDEKQQMEAYPENSFFKKDEKGKALTYGKRGKNGFTEKIIDCLLNNKGQPWHKLLYTKDWLDFAVEAKDFEMEIDGTIKWNKR